MPAWLYAAIVLTFLAFVGFTLAQFAFRGLVDSRELSRWRNVFCALTAITFLIPSFWIAMAFSVLAVLVLGFGAKDRVALFIVTIFALPAYVKRIDGFGSIQTLIDVTPPLIMTVVLLVPYLLSRDGALSRSGKELSGIRLGGGVTDLAAFGYIGLVCVLSFRDVSFTAGGRAALEFLAVSAPLYLVGSRTRWDLVRLNTVAAAFVASFIAYGLIATIEFATNFHHYYEAAKRWDVPFAFRYEQRANMTRTEGPFLGSLTFGAFFMMTFVWGMALVNQLKAKPVGMAGMGPVAFGLLTTLSRGPWAATVIAMAMKAFLSPKGFSGVVGVVMGLGVFFLIVLASPLGAGVLDLLPGFGDGGELKTLDYRVELLQRGSEQVMRDPLFGSTTFGESALMAPLQKGIGFIDYVNAYLHIALQFGLIGLGVYLLALGSAAFGLFRSVTPALAIDPHLNHHVRAILSLVVAFAILLASTSMYRLQLEEMNWFLIGLCVGVARTVRVLGAERAAAATAAPVTPSDDAPISDDAATSQPSPRRHQDIAATPKHLRQYVRAAD